MTQNASPSGAAASDTPFVEKIWKEAGVTFPPIVAEVDGEPCLITSITARPAGSTYVNLTVGDEKRSMVAANHIWIRQQKEINDSAFFGVLSGAPAETTLRYEAAPQTIAEARTKDRAEAIGNSYFLKCKEGDQSDSWRLVSGVEFGPDYLDARSHFDWGEKQRFSFDVISEVVSAQTNREMSIDDLREDLNLRKTAVNEAPSKQFPLSQIALFIVATIGAGIVSYFLLDRLASPAKAPESAKAPQESKESARDVTPPTTRQPEPERASDRPVTTPITPPPATQTAPKATAAKPPVAKKPQRSRTAPSN